MIAPNDSPTFAHTFIANKTNCLLSKRLTDSRAKEDIVVKEPQKPTASKIEYFVSKLKLNERTGKIPSMKLPMTLIINTFTGSIPNSIGEETILYLRNAPANAPTPNNTNSMPFIFIAYHYYFNG